MPDDEQEMLGPGYGHVEASQVWSEAKAVQDGVGDVVAADCIEDHDVLLAALEGVNATYLDYGSEGFFFYAERLDEQVFQVVHLSFIGCYDTYLALEGWESLLGCCKDCFD